MSTMMKVKIFGEVPKACLYVVSHDTFMSGWGHATGKENWIVLPCESMGEAKVVFANVKARGGQRAVNILTPRKLLNLMERRGDAVLWSLLRRENSRWYSETDGFAKGVIR